MTGLVRRALLRLEAQWANFRAGVEPGHAAAVWRDALRSCGVENVVERRMALFQPPRLEGARVPFVVGITPIGAGGSLAAVVRVGGAPPIVALQHESIRLRALKMVGWTEIETGDPVFDQAFFLAGDPIVVRSVFDEPTRSRALRVFGETRRVFEETLSGADGAPIGIADGTVSARFERGRSEITPSSFLADALALIERITDWRAEERLAEIARTDPHHAVRRGALVALRAHRPGHAATLAALDAGCSDPAPNVRLMAASAVGIAKGKETLLALAGALHGPDSVAADAVGELRSHLPADRALAILDAARSAGRHLTVIACLDTLSRLGPHGDVAARVLDEMPNAEVGIAAARALRRCGTPAQVELLIEVASALPRGEPLAEACRAAVAAIQSRQAGASAGQVSLADDEAGRLSVATDESGRLSLGAAQPAGPRDDS